MIKFEKVNESIDTILPKRGSQGSAGYDFYLTEQVQIDPYETVSIDTNIKCKMNLNNVLLIFPRSSIGKKGISLLNTTGIIDADYYNNKETNGHIKIMLKNNTASKYIFTKNERLVQGIIMKYDITDDDNTLEERVGGTGSTGQ